MSGKESSLWLGVFFILGVVGIFPLIGKADAPLLQSTDSWVNVTGSLANMASECGNLTLLSAVPGSNRIIAGVARRGLWANTSGTTWTHLNGSSMIVNRPSWITYDPLDADVFWESGVYNGGGVYQTTDGGNTFKQLGTVLHNDYVSVDFRDPQRSTLLAGGHEQARTIHRSINGGKDWANIGLTLPANTSSSSNPLVLNYQTYLVNALPVEGSGGGVYRTANGGASWQQVSTLSPWGPPLMSLTGAIYWPANRGLLKSTDSGLTWTQVGSNLQAIRPVELPNGRLIAVGANTLMISADEGATWSPIGPALPFEPSGLIFSTRRQAFFIWHNDCGGVVAPNAVMMAS